MSLRYTRSFLLFFICLSVLFLASCAAGDSRFSSLEPAGFWYGLWHGVISVITLVIHIFNDNVLVYETHNKGGWYDFGFLLGVISVWGGGGHVSCKSAAQKKREQEWEEIGDKVEKKVMRKLKNWADEEDVDTVNDEEWEVISQKVEKKLKRKIREWAEKD